MTTIKHPSSCPRCGNTKPPWFEHCRSCHNILKAVPAGFVVPAGTTNPSAPQSGASRGTTNPNSTRMGALRGKEEQPAGNSPRGPSARRPAPNTSQTAPANLAHTCSHQDCSTAIPDHHRLCNPHYAQLMEGSISECRCGLHKPTIFPLCRECQTRAQTVHPDVRMDVHPEAHPAAPTTATPAAAAPPAKPATPIPPAPRGRRYDRHQDEDDPKARDKRYWFNRQENGVCNYCGNRWQYQQLELEHLIPRDLGGPDHRRNTQLACQYCNHLKGTSTDLEFREINRDLLPQEERTPANPPIRPERLREGAQDSRYRPGAGPQNGAPGAAPIPNTRNNSGHQRRRR